MVEPCGADTLVKMFLAHRDSIFGFTLALTRERDAAEEVFQEVGLAVVEEARRETQVVRFLPWVHEIVRRRVAEYYRKTARRNATVRLDSLDEVIAESFQENPGDLVHRDHLAECIEQLPPTQRRMVEGRYRDHSSIRDIARALSWTEGAVKVALWKARRRLEGCVSAKMGEAE